MAYIAGILSPTKKIYDDSGDFLWSLDIVETSEKEHYEGIGNYEIPAKHLNDLGYSVYTKSNWLANHTVAMAMDDFEMESFSDLKIGYNRFGNIVSLPTPAAFDEDTLRRYGNMMIEPSNGTIVTYPWYMRHGIRGVTAVVTENGTINILWVIF